MERAQFGEVINYKAVTVVLKEKGKVRLENTTTEKQAMAEFNMLHGPSTLGCDKISDLVVDFVDSNKKEDSFIVDAEEMLFEMDANNVNEIILKEGFGDTTLVTREQVLSQMK